MSAAPWRVFEIDWDAVAEPTSGQRARAEREALEEREHYVEQLIGVRLRPFIGAMAELLIADLLSIRPGRA